MLNSAAQVNELMQVAAGAVRDTRGRVLIAKRPDGVHQGGLWEFPGGKLQLGESPQDGLARELLEELGIRIRAWRPLIRLQHDYGDRHVVLHVYRIDAYDGIASGQEGQPLAWVKPDAMDPALFPAADRQIINALRLPTLYLITGQNPQSTDSLFCSPSPRACHWHAACATARPWRRRSYLCQTGTPSLSLVPCR